MKKHNAHKHDKRKNDDEHRVQKGTQNYKLKKIETAQPGKRTTDIVMNEQKQLIDQCDTHSSPPYTHPASYSPLKYLLVSSSLQHTR